MSTTPAHVPYHTMKPLDWSYELHIIGTRPGVLSLQDFGELVKKFADLLGNTEKIHFRALRSGSARILAKVDADALGAVDVHLLSMKLLRDSSSKIVRMEEYLQSRGWHGELRNQTGGVVLSFARAKPPKQPEEERLLQQPDTIVGRVIKIGGRDETVPMTLETSEGSYIEVNVKGRDLAKRLALHLFGDEVRVNGLATWKRDAEGVWSCTAMVVDDFEEPDTTSLSELFESLGKVPGNLWNEMDDPVGEWKKLRGDN